MKNKTCIATIATMILMSVANVNCSKDGGDDFFIPILQNQWTNKDNPNNTFFFFNEADSTNTSTFEGNEHIEGNDTTFHFNGSFTNHNIQFTYDDNIGVRSGKTYSGTINDASTVMTLQGNGLPNLTLQKQ